MFLPSGQLKRMNTSHSPRPKGRGRPEREPRLECLVQVRSLDGQRRLGEVSERQADELVQRYLCTEKLTATGRRQYLRLLVPEDELPAHGSIASRVTISHVQVSRLPGQSAVSITSSIVTLIPSRLRIERAVGINCIRQRSVSAPTVPFQAGR